MKGEREVLCRDRGKEEVEFAKPVAVITQLQKPAEDTF